MPSPTYNVAVAVVAALCSAVCYGIASVVQQDAARKAPTGESLRLLLVLGLARQPVWLAGIALAVFSYLLQGLALAFGPLVLVQPLAATDLVFALPLLAYRRKHSPTAGEWMGAGCIVGGVAAFLTVLPTEVGYSIPGFADWLPVLLVVGGAIALLAPLGLRSRGRTRTALYAISAALLFALLDSLTKSAAERFRLDGFEALLHWEPYLLMFVGLTGLVLSQSSFQAGSLAISLPLIDTVEPIGAVLIGIVVFHEHLAASTWSLIVQASGAAIAVTGIALLARSPLARA